MTQRSTSQEVPELSQPGVQTWTASVSEASEERGLISEHEETILLIYAPLCTIQKFFIGPKVGLNSSFWDEAVIPSDQAKATILSSHMSSDFCEVHAWAGTRACNDYHLFFLSMCFSYFFFES